MSVQDKMIDIIASQLSVAKDKVVPQASFVDDLGADSLDLVELVMALVSALRRAGKISLQAGLV